LRFSLGAEILLAGFVTANKSTSKAEERKIVVGKVLEMVDARSSDLVFTSNPLSDTQNEEDTHHT
jgi:hypothetical protein